MSAANPFDVSALQNRITSLSGQLAGTRRGLQVSPNGRSWQLIDTRTPVETGIAQAQAELGVAEQYQQDAMAANRSWNDKLNQGALSSARRRAGGGTFRRRGSSVSPNQLVSNVGLANAKSLAETRRAKALADVAAKAGQNSIQDWSVSLGAPIWLS